MRTWVLALGGLLVLVACGTDAPRAPSAGSKVAGWPDGGAGATTTAVAATTTTTGSGRSPAPTRLPGVTPPPTTAAPVVPAAERSPSRPVATGERVLFVGDSVLAAVAADPVARVRLLGRVDGAVEAETCRRLVETSCTVDGRTPDTAIDAIRRRADGGFTVAVVEAGYNDPSIETAIDVVIRELALIGVRRVLWVTYHDGSGRFGGHNAALSSALGRHPSVLSLIEWGAASDRRPEWFAPDRVHLSPGGAQALAEVIAAAMEGGARARA